MDSAKQEFVASKSLAVVGVSRTSGFGNYAFKELKKKSYRVFPVNAQADSVEGEKCYRRLDDLPEKVDGVLVAVPPKEAAKVVADCARLGIKKVWLQQGSQSPEALRLGQEKGLSVVHDACIMMYAQPTSMHRVHRFIWKLLGKL
jgi:uncharacterized protein